MVHLVVVAELELDLTCLGLVHLVVVVEPAAWEAVEPHRLGVACEARRTGVRGGEAVCVLEELSWRTLRSFHEVFVRPDWLGVGDMYGLRVRAEVAGERSRLNGAECDWCGCGRGVLGVHRRVLNRLSLMFTEPTELIGAGLDS